MVDVLFYAEDPGAANYLCGVPEACRRRGLSLVMFAESGAARFFSAAGEPFEPVQGSVADFFARHAPRLIVCGSSENRRSLGLELIRHGRERGVPTVGAVDAVMGAGFRFRGDGAAPLAYAPDWLFVPDEATRSNYLVLGFDPGRAIVTGHPMYDRLARTAHRLAGVSRAALRARFFGSPLAGRKAVLFAAEISDGLDPREFKRCPAYTLDGRGGSDNRTEVVLEEFLDALPRGEERPFTILRLHPKNREEEFAAYADEVDMVSKAEPVHELLWSCDLIVGMTSTLLAEAAFLGLRTLSVVPRRAERAMLPAVLAAVTPCVWERETLARRLAGQLARADGPGPSPWPELEGAAERAASHIRRIIHAAGG